MDDGDDDRRYLISGADGLSSYLESDVLFWPLQSESQPLTIGNLLLAQKKVVTIQRGPNSQGLHEALDQINQAKDKKRAAWQRKASAEFHSRLTQYKSILMDASEDDSAGVNYSVVARLRAILELLKDEVYRDDQSDVLLANLDGKLKALVSPSGFLWSNDLQESFPAEKYWFLYAKSARGGVR